MSTSRAAACVRRATPADVAALAQLKRDTFRETFLEDFAIPYPAEDLAIFEAQCYSPEHVATEIADPTHATWLCADTAGRLLAYAHAGPCKLPHPDAHGGAGELYQIYVRKEARGRGLGPALLAAVLDWIAENFEGSAWLGVWSGNLPAQAFYASAGFRKIGDYDFMVGAHRDAEYIFRRD